MIEEIIPISLTGIGLVGVLLIFLVLLVISAVPIWISQKILFPDRGSIGKSIAQLILINLLNSLLFLFLWVLSKIMMIK